MGNRLGMNIYGELLNSARTNLLALVGNRSMDDIVTQIIGTAVSFGHDEAERPVKQRTAPLAAPKVFADYHEMRDEAKVIAIEALFNGKGLNGVAEEIALMGAAWGFQKRVREIQLEKNPALKRANDLVALHSRTPNKQLTLEQTDELFEAINGCKAEYAVEFGRTLLIEARLGIDTRSEQWKTFVDTYRVLVA